MGKKKIKSHINKPEVKNKPKSKPKRKAQKVVLPSGKAFITSSFNNTIITLTDLAGNTVSWGSTGVAGFSGTRKSTPFAASMAAQKVAEDALSMGLREVQVFVKGPGIGREGAIRALKTAGLAVRSITDVTPIPHNGCRPRKRRRV